ncbi:hypothetical protein niasHT_025256 [Heterodera trifolii]|uniref:Uncharacterized protein n=1 Tax=Heterodera trifolii TaxID=157864 RepID=A0ABD2KF97_9BILA
MYQNSKEVIDFAAENLGCEKGELAVVLQRISKRSALTKLITETLNRGATLWYRLDDGYIQKLGNKLSISADRPFIGSRPRVSHRIFAFQILRIRRTQGSVLGPMVVTGGVYYPLGGLIFRNFRDQYDDFGEFFAGFMKEELVVNVAKPRVKMGEATNKTTCGEEPDEQHVRDSTKVEIVSKNLNLIVSGLNGNLKVDYESLIGTESQGGEAIFKIRGRGMMKGTFFLLILCIWCTAFTDKGVLAMKNGNEKATREGNVNNEFNFSEEMQLWERELGGDDAEQTMTQKEEEPRQEPELENVPSTSRACSLRVGEAKTECGKGNETNLGGKGMENGKNNCDISEMVMSTGLPNGFQLDGLNWAQVHQCIPPPSLFYPNPKIMRTAIVQPQQLAQQPQLLAQQPQLLAQQPQPLAQHLQQSVQQQQPLTQQPQQLPQQQSQQLPQQPQQLPQQQSQQLPQQPHQLQLQPQQSVQQPQHFPQQEVPQLLQRVPYSVQPPLPSQQQQQQRHHRPLFGRENRFTSRRIGPNRSHPYTIRLPTAAQQPFREAQEVQPSLINWPWDTPPNLNVPFEIRRVLLRRLAQEREHAFGLAGAVHQWNPPMAILLLALEAFYSSLLAMAVNEDGGSVSAQH